MILFFRKLDRILKSTKSSEDGYTLLELLVVLAILALILGIAVPAIIGQFSKAKVETAKIQVSSLAANLEFFYLDVGRYPTDEEGLQVLVDPPANARGWNGPYIRQRSSLMDPWGTPYLYKSSTDEPKFFEVYSLGADGKPGGEGENRDISSNE